MIRKNNYYQKYIITGIILLLLFPISLFSKNQIAGSVDLLYGKVEIQREDKIITPSLGSKILYKDKIQTYSQSKIGIKLINGDKISLPSDKKIDVKETIKNALSQRPNKFWTMFKKILKNQPQNEFALTAVTGARGRMDEQTILNSIKQIDILISQSKNQDEILDLLLIKAELYMKIGNNKKAKEIYQEVLRKDKKKKRHTEIKGTMALLDMVENIPVGVMNFEGKDNEKSKLITDVVITDLAKSGILKLSERSQLEKVLKEQELTMSGIVENKKKVMKIGKLTGVEYIIVGSYKTVSDKIVINARLVSIETGEIVKGWSSEGNKDEILFYSHQIASLIHLFLTDKDIPEQELTKSIQKTSNMKEIKDIQVYLGFDRQGVPPEYKNEEKMKVYFKVTGKKDKKYYITILNIGTEGEINLLFPNSHNLDNKIELNKLYEIPGKDDDYDLEVYGKPGKNLIVGIVTEKPLGLVEQSTIKEEVFPLLSSMPDNYLQRGVKVEADKSGVKRWKIGKVHFLVGEDK